MNAEQAESRRARLFVALDLPQALRDGIATWGAEELADPALRAVPPESLHVTLAFLGQTELAAVERIEAAMAESTLPAPLIELGDPVAKPSPRRPRLFALPAHAPGAEPMQARLAETLIAAGLYRAGKRPFWPHVTIARVRNDGRGSRRPALVSQPPEKLPDSLSEAFYGVRMTLYRSVLQPQGARYVPLAQVELPGAGRQ